MGKSILKRVCELRASAIRLPIVPNTIKIIKKRTVIIIFIVRDD